MIDVVYVLGSGSAWHNNEIRFSLRALEKNLRDYQHIYVVGIKPDWLKNVRHIPHVDELIHNADGNIARKVLRVCQEEDLTEKFLFINDDHFINKPVRAADIPPYHKGDLTRYPEQFFQQSFWRGRLWRTKNVLLSRGFTTLHYDCHTPLVINKKLFPQALSQFDYEVNIGYTMKSMYANVVHGNSGQRLNGEKVTIFKKMTLKEIRRRCNNSPFVAVNDAGLNGAFKQWLFESYTDPSCYEGEGTNNDFIEVLAWLKGPRDYHEGIELFNRYGKSRKIKKFLEKSETTARKMKLEHQMKELLNEL